MEEEDLDPDQGHEYSVKRLTVGLFARYAVLGAVMRRVIASMESCILAIEYCRPQSSRITVR